MDERPVSPDQAPAEYDIFLCTRELPDALTPETAALRQLCSALIGSGWRVFFPSALPADLTDEERAGKIVEALQHSKVMVAAGVGAENAADPVAEKLRSAFMEAASKDDSLRFIACWRDAGPEALPADLAGREVLDMSDLSFLVTLKDRLTEWLVVPEEEQPEEPEYEAAPAPDKKPFPWKWLLLAAVAVAAVIFFLVKR